METITYRDGYKYQLVEPYTIQTAIKPSQRVQALFLNLTTEGILHIGRGYAWDGASGPAIDTPDFMRGSLVHDAFYQMIRNGRLDPDERKVADGELYRICLEDGMSAVRAKAVYEAVRAFGGNYAGTEKPPLIAPRAATSNDDDGFQED